MKNTKNYSERDKEILKLYNPGFSFTKIAKKFHISKQRVNKIYRRELAKLKK